MTESRYINDDYAQSANTLFHFMKEPQYLKEILLKKAIVPRFCKENIEYLRIRCGEKDFKEIYVLQKCFCDIPFHKLTEVFKLTGLGETYESLSDSEKFVLSQNNTHLDFYGEYAIAFSKGWGEKNNLQPIHYLNDESGYTKDFSSLVTKVLSEDNVEDIFANDVLNRLSFIKPVRGIMSRKMKRQDKNLDVDLYKNFHDEKEWRYVPARETLDLMNMEPVIASPFAIAMLTQGQDVNEVLHNEKYRPIWLKYNYDDIRYIIVPDSTARIDIINTIDSIEDEMFENGENIKLQKSILVSKIIVIDEVRKDW